VTDKPTKKRIRTLEGLNRVHRQGGWLYCPMWTDLHFRAETAMKMSGTMLLFMLKTGLYEAPERS